ncbi:MAG: hypothetical protein LBK99_09875 [Opitutaceae bacterium]|jgi:hypothetical protein|nr:hypothetical protein [Opitutaceae bacterium]
MKNAMNACKQKPDTHGAIVFFSLFVIMAILVVMAGLLAISRGITMMSQTVDIVRQTSIEKQILEDVVRRTVMSRIGVAGDNNKATTDDTIDALLDRLNAGAGAGAEAGTGTGVSIARTTASPVLPVVRMFPDADVPPTATPSLASENPGFQLADLIGGRAARLTAMPTPLVWHFSRTGSRALENRTCTIEADVWAVPLVNWSLVAYGLPASGAVPSSAPSGVVMEKWLASVHANGGRSLVLTTLKPGPASEGGDPTAFAMLYREPHDGREILPRYYQNMAAVAWDAWEFVWGPYLMKLAGHASASGMYCDLSSPPSPPPAGVIPDEGVFTINLDLVPAGVLTLYDGMGGHIVNLQGGSATRPLVVVILNYTPVPTIVNLSGNNSSPVILYACNSGVRFSGATLNGGLFLDKTSTLAGTGTINGTLAFYANNPPSSASNINLFPSVTDASDAVSPRVVLVSTKSRLN